MSQSTRPGAAFISPFPLPFSQTARQRYRPPPRGSWCSPLGPWPSKGGDGSSGRWASWIKRPRWMMRVKARGGGGGGRAECHPERRAWPFTIASSTPFTASRWQSMACDMLLHDAINFGVTNQSVPLLQKLASLRPAANDIEVTDKNITRAELLFIPRPTCLLQKVSVGIITGLGKTKDLNRPAGASGRNHVENEKRIFAKSLPFPPLDR